MKILLCHSNKAVMERLLERPLAAGHTVLPCSDATHLVPLIGASEPHLVVIGGRDLCPSAREIEDCLVELQFQVRVIVLPNECQDPELDGVWRMLATCDREPLSVHFDDDRHSVLLAGGELNEYPRLRIVSNADLATQENRFLALLEAGKAHHHRAQGYLSAVLATQRNYETEWTVAALCGDPALLFWRTQLCRYFAALAHYLPGIDLDCLPLPHPPSPLVEVLTPMILPEASYAMKAADAFGMNRHLLDEIRSATAGNSSNSRPVLATASRLAGLVALLRETAKANNWIIDGFVGNEPATVESISKTRHTRDRYRIFCLWWGLWDFAEKPDALVNLAAAFEGGRRAVDIPRPCSFFEFIQQEVDKVISRN